MFPLSNKNKQVAVSIVEKLKTQRQERGEKLPVISFEYLYNILDNEEKLFVTNLLKQNPKEYGFKEQLLGIKKVPLFLKKIKGQKYLWEGGEKIVAPQYLPRNVWRAYKKLTKNMQKEIQKIVLIKSCYRSPAYQVLTFLYYLVEEFKFDYKKTMALVALPGYSEHGYPARQAIDFITKNGALRGEKIGFEDTQEYKWLLKNADKHNFHLSYSKNNTLGVAFESWHWHYSAKR